jgi:glycosyltransferase involved in cell wall biosynthesis
MMCIFILTELYYPERTSTAYFLTETAQGLVDYYEVRVVTGASMYESRSVSLPQYEVVQGVEVQRCRSTTFDKNWLPGRLINACTRAIAIFFKILWQCHSTDVILVVTNPPLLPLVAWLLKGLKGCEFVLLVHDVYPEALSVSRLICPASRFYRVVEAINIMIYRQACRIITLGRDMQELISQKLPQSSAKKVVCIPHWAELEIIYPLKKDDNPLRQRLNLVDKFVVLYAGNMGRTHDLQILLAAAEVLVVKQPHIHFLLIGVGVRQLEIEAMLQHQPLHNVTLMAYLPHDEKNRVLNCCDVGVISFLPGMAGVSVPSRMYNQMAAGKPLIAIADHESELAKVICEENIGWLITPGDCDQLVNVLIQAAAKPEICAEMGQRASATVQQKYTLNHALASYRVLFEELLPIVEPSRPAGQALNRS